MTYSGEGRLTVEIDLEILSLEARSEAEAETKVYSLLRDQLDALSFPYDLEVTLHYDLPELKLEAEMLTDTDDEGDDL